MPATPQLSALVQALVPLARSDENLRRELIENSQDILSTHIGQNKDGDITHLGGIIQRRLLQSSPTSGGLEAQRFRNLLSRLLEQKDVTRKHAILLFLDSLSLSQPDTATPSSSSFLPSLAPQTSQALRITQNQPAPAQSGQDTSRPPSGKSKAEILRNFRAKAGYSLDYSINDLAPRF
ncbi:Microtubule-nucleating Tub4p (gamma-tubulin) complex component [Tulasnella sp. 403]|nr:Microtubule-nucleating Tub4p (gamma-tubulin) complex component [Tulasnella sp. 403]